MNPNFRHLFARNHWTRRPKAHRMRANVNLVANIADAGPRHHTIFAILAAVRSHLAVSHGLGEFRPQNWIGG